MDNDPSATVRRRTAAPLYDARYEHDACGVGFVADAGGRSRDRVLPLALAGLAALGHRGAFGADGESSDGAGVALPLDRSLLELLAGDAAAARPGIVSLFLPRGRAAERGAGRSSRRPSPRPACRSSAGGRCPVDVERAGCRGRRVTPGVRPGDRRRGRLARRGRSAPAHRRRLRAAAGRRPAPPRDRRPRRRRARWPSSPCRRPRRGRSSTRAWSSAAGCPSSIPTCARRSSVGYAVFHQRYATNTHPVWRLAQPFRSIAHNGEINTVRGNREEVRGRAGDAAGSADRAATCWRPARCSPPDGSDSLSLDEALELLMATGWELTPALLTAIPEALALRRAPHPHVATLRRRTAGFLAPWDGPAAIVFADGRRVGALVDRNGLRPAAFAVTRDRLVAVASEAGRGAVHRGRDGPSRPTRAGRAAARRAGSPRDPRGRRGEGLGAPRAADPRRAAADPRGPARRRPAGRSRRRRARDRPPTTSCATSPASMPSAPGSTSRRWRSRATSRSGAWATTRPTPGRGRLDRPVADHLRQAFAQVTNPAIDPERERIVMDLRVELGRRPALLGGPAARATDRRACSGRSSPTSTGSSPRSVRGRARPSGRSTRPGIRPMARAGLEAALERLAAEAVAAARRGAEVLLLTDAAWSIDRLPDPVDPGDRRRPHRADRRRAARPDGPRGQRRRRPRRPRDGDAPRGRRHRRPPAPGDRARRRAGGNARRRGR